MVAVTRYSLASVLLTVANTARGTTTRRIAFSCTCHPNMKQDHAQRVSARRKEVREWGESQSLAKAGRNARSMITAVAEGGTEGRTVWLMSCTRPPVMLAVATSMGNLPSRLPITANTLSATL